MNLMPTSNRILIKPIADEQVTKGGILLPETVEKPVKYAEVLQVGPKVVDIAIGDTVVFGKYMASVVEDGLFLLKDEDVLALMK